MVISCLFLTLHVPTSSLPTSHALGNRTSACAACISCARGGCTKYHVLIPKPYPNTAHTKDLSASGDQLQPHLDRNVRNTFPLHTLGLGLWARKTPDPNPRMRSALRNARTNSHLERSQAMRRSISNALIHELGPSTKASQ